MSEESKELVPAQTTAIEAMDVGDVKRQVDAIQDLMKSVMKEGVHYGRIPGTGPKPMLLKPGAEKLGFTFRLMPFYEIHREDLENGHREYSVTCTLHHMPTEREVCQGVGNCSTLEKKYRHQAPADIYNTVLKMSKKRAHTDSILAALAASDIFAQDLEDIHESPKQERQAQLVKEAPEAAKALLETRKSAHTFINSIDDGILDKATIKKAKAYIKDATTPQQIEAAIGRLQQRLTEKPEPAAAEDVEISEDPEPETEEAQQEIF